MIAALVVLLMTGLAVGTPASDTESRPASGPPLAAEVRPLDLARLRARLKSLGADEAGLIRQYMEAAARDVLKPEDGCFPITPPAIAPRNWAERAKGAAVLACFEGYWPEDLRRRCRERARELIREVAAAHRAEPNFAYEWQASYWAAEAGIAAWFLWDELDPDLREAVAEMVIFQADRFIGKTPKMGFRGNTEAETVSWDSSILTLAVNMMPDHPHHAHWDQAAKRYVYNTFAVPQDAKDESIGDDGRRVRDWIVGANLYEDFALENHGQFHIDYVLACYRFHIQGAAMYGLAGRPLPQAFRHHARDMYEKILLRCTDGEGFFVYVSDNDWKRYHAWAESCSVHAYLATLEKHPLAAALERRALANASRHWQAMPKDFAFDNPYVCGKAWTSRIADAVLIHLTAPEAMPRPLPDVQVNERLRGTGRVNTPELLTHHAADGSFRSSCRGKGEAWVRYVAPREGAWMLLPIAGNYEPTVAGKPLLGKCEVNWKNGRDWFWVVRQDEASRAEAFVSLPDATAIYSHFLPVATLRPSEEIVNSIAIEKPFSETAFRYDGGQATYSPGQKEWQFDQGKPEITGDWINLHDRIGWVVRAPGTATAPSIRLPEPGKRGRLEFVSRAAAGDHVLFVFALPNQPHTATQAASGGVRCSRDNGAGALFRCQTPEYSLIINMSPVETVLQGDEDHPTADRKLIVPPRSVLCEQRAGHRSF